MGERDRRRGPRRQVLGVAGLTAVASGTTALVIGMGSSQLVAPDLLATPYAEGSSGGPLVVDEPRIPAPAATGSTRGGTAPRTDTGRAVGTAPVTRTPPGPVAPVPAPPPSDGTTAPIRLPEIPVPGIGDGSGGPDRPFPGTQPGIQDPNDPDSPDSPDDPDDADSPDDPDSPEGHVPDGQVPGDDRPGVDEPQTPTPGAPADGSCRLEAEGLQLPVDVVRRLEEWLCGVKGRPVTVIAKPLKLLRPVVPAVEVTTPVGRVGVVYSPRHAALERAAQSSAAKRHAAAEAAGDAIRAQARAEARKAVRQAEARQARARQAGARKAEDRRAARDAARQADRRAEQQRAEQHRAEQHRDRHEDRRDRDEDRRERGHRSHGFAAADTASGHVSNIWIRYEGKHRVSGR